MTIAHKLFSAVDIRPGERRVVLLMLAHSFCMGLSRIFVKTSAYALFVAEFNAQSLPYVYVATSLVVTLISSLYLSISKRVRFFRLLKLNLVFLLAMTLLIRFGLALPGFRWLKFVLPIWYEMLWALTGLEFWGLAGQIFDVRQGKRLFGLLGFGEQFALIVGGFLTPLLVQWGGAKNLFLIASGTVAGMLLLFRVTSGLTTLHYASPEQSTERQRQASSLFTTRYVLLIFLLIALLWTSYFFHDNIFYNRASAQFPDENRLAGFTGMFFAVTGLLTSFSTLVFTGEVVKRYGLQFTLLVMPVMLAISTAAMIILGMNVGGTALLFWLTAITFSLHRVLLYSVDRSGLSLLYQPFAGAQRVQVQTTAEGIVYPVAVGCAGLLLLVFNKGFMLGVLGLIGILFGLSVLRIGVAALLGREYPLMLQRALSRRSLDKIEVDLLDATTISTLEQGLKSSQIGVLLYSLETLEKAKPESLLPVFPCLLEHPAPEVRYRVLQSIEQQDFKNLLPVLQDRLIREPSAVVRGELLRTIAALGQEQVVKDIQTYLHDPEPAVRRGAIAGLLRYGGIYGVILAGQDVLRHVNSPDPAERMFVAQVLQDVKIKNFYQPLLSLLEDMNIAVRKAAIIASGHVGHPKLWPLVVKALHAPGVKTVAMSALVSGGETTLPVLKETYRQQQQNPMLLVRIAHLCGRIQGQQALGLLLEMLPFPDERVSQAVLYALSQRRYQASEQDIEAIRKQIIREIAYSASTLAILRDLADDRQVILLRRALTDRFHHARERVLYLLSFLYESQSVLQTAPYLCHARSEKRAYALEILETLLEKSLKPHIMPLFDELSVTDRLRQLQSRFPQSVKPQEDWLRQIIHGRRGEFSFWIRACAVYALTFVEISFEEKVRLTVSALADSSRLVRETAFQTLRTLEVLPSLQTGSVLPADLTQQAMSYLQTSQHEGGSAMLIGIEKILFLRNVELFARVPDENLVQIAEIAHEVTFEAGERFITQGNPGDCLYVTVSGEVNIEVDGVGKVAARGENSVNGEMAILSDKPRTASCVAATEVTALKIEREEFLDLLKDMPEISLGIIQVLTQRLDEMSQKIKH